MTTTLLLEIFAGFFTAFIALWMLALNRPTAGAAAVPISVEDGDPAPGTPILSAVRQALSSYLLREGRLANTGLLVLRLAIGAMMIHHGQDKLADPQAFATNYVVPLHLPFPLFLAHVAGYSEILGSWLLILGLLSPLGALALTGTMGVAAYHHILTSGLNIYVLELVVLYLGGSLALLLVGPGRYSFDAGILSDLLRDGDAEIAQDGTATAGTATLPTYGLAAEAG
ncbi:DoxX family protein [Cyanobium sp. Cruz CV13-4-11]|jgi:putative oxidoreductase|uniref:DoxX family protein n=1 Tax=unclassified Cyanobium TaxID=2627006 RepID=UPI0020CC1673|nr:MULTISPECIES: DoxX family protein [unclassified Cyanobium]MCP9900900.1 DoxX family protein [Cyanobium sp. Cruz CV11-17]MCP9919066.1 DoxX family protein [Cyanobium sp. Cruz CV13-4-11]